MRRILPALAMLLTVVGTLGAVQAQAPALIRPEVQPIDQARWPSRKQRVRLSNGLEIAYVELGERDAPPVLLLHGYTDNSRVWSLVAPYLSGYRLLIPDQRGHGDSSAPECCYALADFTDDARLFLDAMDVQRAAVVGHSYGSMVAQALAADHPERVERIILAGSTALAPVRRSDGWFQSIMAMREPIASNRDFLAEWSPRASPTPVDPAFLSHHEAEIAAVPRHVWRAVLRDLIDLPIGRYAPDVRAPVFILSAGADALFGPEHHRSLVAAYPGAPAYVLPGLGHNLIVEQPSRTGPIIAGLLRAPAAPRAAP
jgi:pimeloyl-ACP methyl ester carboxylesterase